MKRNQCKFVIYKFVCITSHPNCPCVLSFRYGAENVDSYLSSFTPLEYTVLHMENNPCIAKVVVNKMAGCDYNKVLGLHIAAPNAGEIIQGFGVAIKKGITYDDLMSTVGIHPTVAEELVQATVSKSSGESADKGGC